MKKLCQILLFSGFLALLPGTVSGAEGFIFGGKKKKAAESSAASGETTDSLAQKKNVDYDKLFKDPHDVAEGFITLRKVKGKLYFELPLELIGREMLIGSTITETSDNRNGVVGSKPQTPLHVFFTKEDEYIQLREMSRNAITDTPGSPMDKALDRAMAGSILRNMKIEAYTPDSTAVVFEMTDFFLSDNKSLSPFDIFSYYTLFGRRYNRTESFRKESSYLGDIKAYEDNVSIKSILSYNFSLTSEQGQKIGENVPFTAEVTRSILLLDEEPYRPRVGDYRINVFPTGQWLFGENSQGSRVLYYSNRWRVEPSDTEAFLKGHKVDPVKPIVFYVDNTFPEKWKPYIRAGIEQWNDAFEEIGLTNVVIARDFPEDDPEFDPDNLKYSCVRYAPVGIQNAMGPSWTDPRSGEIITASVYVYHDIIKVIRNWLFVQTAQADQRIRTADIPDGLLGDALKYVIAHEIGHCLGFMHQFSGSSVIPVDSLRSPSFTAQHGTTTSIMDYARFNYVAQPGDAERGVKLTPPDLGVYDKFAVKWLYTPMPGTTPEEEEEILSSWLRETSHDPWYLYGKQEMAVLDPRSQSEDLGDDAVKASEYGISNLKYILANYEQWMDGQSDPEYTHRKEILNGVLSQYIMYLRHVQSNIGGIYIQQFKHGDSGKPYDGVPKSVQKRALDFLLKQHGTTSWMDRPEILSKIPVMASPSNFIENYLNSLIVSAPYRLILKEDFSDSPYSFEECFQDVYRFVWEPTMKGVKPDEARMKLQSAFVHNCLVQSGLVASPKATMGKAFSGEAVLGLENPEVLLPVQPYTCGCADHDHGTEIHSNTIGGYGTPIILFMVAPDLKGFHYARVKQMSALLKNAAASSTGEVKAHYDYLLLYITKSLKADK